MGSGFRTRFGRVTERSRAQRLADLLTARRFTIATAESCTGGLVAHHITAVAGSSTYFPGGVVTYSNELKRSLLGVPEEVLEHRGAVSPECALAMARGVRRLTGADVGVSTTGIAGPGGATARKPVGLIYVACSAPGGDVVEEHRWHGTRLENIALAADAALALVVGMLDGSITPGED